MKYRFFIIPLLLITLKVYGQNSRPNIVLITGDGMGLSHITMTMDRSPDTLNLTRFTHIGLIRTNPGGRAKITDSSAGATAFSIGEKTYNGAIGVSLDSIPKKTILEQLQILGYETGIVVTSTVTHATPGSFYAHVLHWSEEEQIAQDLLSSEVDFIAGGGYKYFLNREDSLNLIDRFRESNYAISIGDLQSLDSIDISRKVLMLSAPMGLPKNQDGRGEFLVNATENALEKFSNSEEPFFLMIEGSQIDWGGHSNDVSYIVEELRDFDRTIGVVLDYIERNDQNTVGIVTADHETGGLALSGTYPYDDFEFKFVTDNHTGTMVPVFAAGIRAELYQGIYHNTEIYHKLRAICDPQPNSKRRLACLSRTNLSHVSRIE